MPDFVSSLLSWIALMQSILLLLTGCAKNLREAQQTQPTPTAATQASEKTSEDRMKLIIKNQTFAVTLERNGTAEAFRALCPITLNLSELNGNEKYRYLDVSLPSDAKNPGRIEAGDIMLYGANCIVVFYQSFDTSYSYTKIGHIDDITGLVDALGGGSVTVVFQ